MKNIQRNKILLVLGTLLVGLLLGWLLFGSNEQHNSPSEKVENNSTIWTCSMHPQIRQPEPGDCPICGMELIPLAENEGDSENPAEIRMSATAMQLANIQTSIISKKKPVKEVRMNGKIQADERQISTQTSHIPGRIEKLMVNFTGESIQKGQVLAYVYSPELVTAQEELLEAEKMKGSQANLFNAAKEKLKNWKLTEEQIDQIIRTKKTQEQFPILADASGIILNKMTNVGDYVKTGQALFEVVNLKQIWVLLDIYESDLPWIKKGDPVKFYTPSFPGETFSGIISFIDPVIDPKTRVASARIEVPNPGLRLKPEMFVTAVSESPIQQEKEALIVPKSAVMWTGERSVVYVKNQDPGAIRFAMREVTLGPALGDTYVIKSGLEEGEEIATNGTFSIDAAAQLAGKPSMMNKQMPEKNTVKDSKAIVISAKAKHALSPLFTAYFQFKDALVKDGTQKAIAASQEMKRILSKIDMRVFTGEAHIFWMELNSRLDKSLDKISPKQDIESVRITFKEISDGMIQLAKSFGKMDSKIYIDYCPMAIDDQGAEWLSQIKEIQNPYFGASMRRCGEIRSEIK